MVESFTTRRTFLADLASAVGLLCVGAGVSGCRDNNEYQALPTVRLTESERKEVNTTTVPLDTDLTPHIHAVYSLEIPRNLHSLSPTLYRQALHRDDSYLFRDISVVADGVIETHVKADILLSDYLALRSQNHRVASHKEYARFLTPHPDITMIAQALIKDRSSTEQSAQRILDYVHSGIIYDASIEQKKDYVRHPLETLVEGNGDCEDTTILTTALSRAGKLDVVLVHFDPPVGSLEGHIGYAVAGDFHGTYFKVNGKNYFYAETTGTLRLNKPASWKIGEFPQGYEQRVIDIYTLQDAPLSKSKKQHSKKEKSQKRKVRK